MKIEGKSILVTGADGFIGSHLVEALVDRGVDVTALSCYNSFNYWGWLETLDPYYFDAIYVISGDIRDRDFMGMITDKIDIIFHLAALIAIPYSYQAPDSYVDTNVNGTLNICHAALEHQCERVVHVSTSEVYGTARYVPINEGHPLQAQSPYGASKIGGDAIAASFHHSYSVPVVIARPFNTYGPRQSARAIIPTIISQIAAGEKKIRLGSLSSTRDFNYVKDTVQGLIQLAECDRAVGDVVNIGSNTEISIKELVELIKKLMNSNAAVKEDETRFRPDTSEVGQLRCDNTKIKRLTGYTPQYTLEQGLQETIQWIEKNLEKYKIDRYNM